MKKTFILFLAAVFLLNSAAFSAAGKGNVKGYFYEVKSKSATVYLLGSIHFADESFYPLPKHIMKAFKKAATLGVEADILNIDQQKLQETILAKALFTDGTLLSSVISDTVNIQLNTLCSELGVPPDTFKTMKPWFVSFSLSGLMAMSLGLKPELGIDIFFLSKAAEAGKKILELESLGYQIDLLSGLDMEKQVKFLEITMKEFKSSSDTMIKMKDVWKAGDEKGMEELLESELDDDEMLKEFNTELFEKRNIKMKEKIEDILQNGKGVYFVIVGAGHLIGNDGIVELLRTKNFKVKKF